MTYLSSNGQSAPIYKIDPSKANGGEFSEYFENIEYIALETNKESLFGFVVQLLITDSSLVISDLDTHSVLFFSKSGQFIRKVKGKGNLHPNISYDDRKKEVLLSTFDEISHKTKLRYYSCMGVDITSNPIHTRSYSNKKFVGLGAGYYAGVNSCYYKEGMLPTDSIINLLEIYKEGTLYNSFFPYNQKERCGVCAFGYGIIPLRGSPEKGVIYVSTPLDYNIYRVSRDSVSHICQLVFPMDRTFPRKIWESGDPKQIDSVRRTKWQNETTITNLNNIFINGKLLFFKINSSLGRFSLRPDHMKPYNFIYNTEDEKLVALERIVSDSLSFFLPFYNGGISITGLDFNDGYFYTHISSLELFEAGDKVSSKGIVYPNSIQSFFKIQNKKSNPVIIRFKLKQAL